MRAAPCNESPAESDPASQCAADPSTPLLLDSYVVVTEEQWRGSASTGEMWNVPAL
jgi:hypothetical protein